MFGLIGSDPFANLDSAPDTAPEQPRASKIGSDPFADMLPAPPPAPPEPETLGGAFKRGLSKTLPEAAMLTGATAAYVGDVLGAEGLKRGALDLAQKYRAVDEELSRPDDSFTHALSPEGSVPRFLANAAGYTVGQAAEMGAAALAGGALGSGAPGAGTLAGAAAGVVAKGALSRTIRAYAEREIAKQAGKGLAEEAATRAAGKAIAGRLGAGGALGATNLNMELGGIYQDAVEQAQQDGRELDAGDKARIAASALAAAGIETATDTFGLHRLLGGASGTNLLGRAAREIPAGMAREGLTEAAQTAIEHYGAGKPVADEAGLRDIIDSAALGAVGGGLFGAGASLRGRQGALPPRPGGLEQPFHDPRFTGAQAGQPLSEAQIAAARAQAQADAARSAERAAMREGNAAAAAGALVPYDEAGPQRRFREAAGPGQTVDQGYRGALLPAPGGRMIEGDYSVEAPMRGALTYAPSIRSGVEPGNFPRLPAPIPRGGLDRPFADPRFAPAAATPGEPFDILNPPPARGALTPFTPMSAPPSPAGAAPATGALPARATASDMTALARTGAIETPPQPPASAAPQSGAARTVAAAAPTRTTTQTTSPAPDQVPAQRITDAELPPAQPATPPQETRHAPRQAQALLTPNPPLAATDGGGGAAPTIPSKTAAIAAARRASRAGVPHEAVAVDGGWRVQPIAQAEPKSPALDVARTEAAAAESLERPAPALTSEQAPSQPTEAQQAAAEARYSRTPYSAEATGPGIHPAVARRAADSVTRALGAAVRIEVHDTQPEHFGMDHAVKGAYDPRTNTVHLVAGNLASTDDALATLRHEIIGHLGVEAATGRDWPMIREAILQAHGNAAIRDLLHRTMREEFATAAGAESGAIRSLDAEGRDRLARETIARAAESPPNGPWWRRVLGMIWQALRRVGLVRGQMRVDELHALLREAEGAVRDGGRVSRGAMAYHRAYHGSPHEFERFDLGKIGTGEGAQVYGHGLYFAGAREVAEHYREALPFQEAIKSRSWPAPAGAAKEDAQAIETTRKVLGQFYGMWDMNEIPREVAKKARELDSARTYLDRMEGPGVMTPEAMQKYPEFAAREREELESARRMVQSAQDAVVADRMLKKYGIGAFTKQGRLYEVELAPKEADYLDWDKPLSGQSAKVKTALREAYDRLAQGADSEPVLIYGHELSRTAGGDINVTTAAGRLGALDSQNQKITGAMLYKMLSEKEGGPEAASRYLAGIGIPGIRYFDGTSRGKGKGNHNYVIFDDKHVEVTMRYSRISNLAQTVSDAVSDRLYSGRTFNVLNRTVGTSFHKAWKDPQHFGPVYQRASQFLKDAQAITNRAATNAPSILPKLDGISDIKATIQRHIGQKDIDAAAKALMGGRLADRLWTRAELRAGVPGQFEALTEHQVNLYLEARKAIDASLDDVAASTMARIARLDGAPEAIIAQARANPADAFAILSPHVKPESTARLVEERERIQQLKRDGYAPLSRFGDYWVRVTKTDAEGNVETLHRSHYDTAAERNAAARALREDAAFKDADIESGILSKEDSAAFQGLTPETLELFGDSIELPGGRHSELFQEFLKTAVANNSALKRLIHARKIAGFSEDMGRGLASFLLTNGRFASRNYHVGEMNKAWQKIPEAKGDVRDEARRLIDYVVNPREEAQGVRALLFAHFLGGSAASALVNMTQPVLMSWPHLSTLVGPARAANLLRRALPAAFGRPIRDPGLRAAMQRAAEDGIVAPQEIHQLYAEAIRSGLTNHPWVRVAATVWGSMFSISEQWNRRLTFAAAYMAASERNEADPFAFAERAVTETQGEYTKANRPNVARGPVGSLAFVFKQFSVGYVEFLKRLPMRERLMALGLLALASGLKGLPGAEDAEDLADTVLQAFGYNTRSHDWLQRHIGSIFGAGAADFMMHGVSALGLPIDVQGRLGVGNLIPGTAIFKRSETDKSRDVLEFAGPLGGVVKQWMAAWNAMASGLAEGSMVSGGLDALKAMAPSAVQNVVKGEQERSTGFALDTRGRRIAPVTGAETAGQYLGFRPGSVAAQARREDTVREASAFAKVEEGAISDLMARGRFERDPALIRRAQERLREWNSTNPETPIRIEPGQIRSRLRALASTREERLLKSVPKEQRAGAREQLATP